MSELSLPALVEANANIPAKSRLPMQELHSAYKACKFGLFHIKLLVIAFVAFISGVLVTNTTSYLLPIAECDLDMSLLQKGLLNAIPYIGMLISSLVAGFMTDAFGRKMFVVGGNLGIFVCAMIGGSSQTYEVLISAKFFEGIFFAASFSAVVTLTSEFCHNENRDRILLCQSSFAGVAQLVVALMAWGILTHDWKYTFFDGKIVLNIWNFYLYAMATWPISATILYTLFIPESPKFLLTQGKYDEARAILIKMYRQNTWKSAESFPFINIWKDKTTHSLKEEPEDENEKGFRHQIVMGLHNIKPMFQKPLLGYLILICFMNLFTMALANIVRLWFPQLSTVVEHYKRDDSQDLCEMLDAYTYDLRLKMLNRNVTDVCVATKSGTETYINSIIVGCVCVIPYFVTGVLVNRVGKKRLFLMMGMIVFGSILGIRWANTKTAIVALFAVTLAVSQVMMSLQLALVVEYFQTNTRTFAISMIMVAGRIGTLIGNVGFPVVLEFSCAISFYSLAVMMAGCVALGLLLPKKK